MKIEGSIALVTGANRGLGKALVAALLEARATRVYAAARDVARLAVTDARVIPLALDTTDPGQVAAAARRASDVTLLINNAGVQSASHVLTASAESFDADFRTNVFGPLAVIKALLPALERAHGGATIVNVLSLSSLSSFPPLGGYAASKAAAYSVTQGLRPELRRRGIALLAALPGPIDTDMTAQLDLPKTSAAEVARAVLAGIECGDEEIFPDPMSQQLGGMWTTNPKALERTMGAI